MVSNQIIKRSTKIYCKLNNIIILYSIHRPIFAIWNKWSYIWNQK